MNLSKVWLNYLKSSLVQNVKNVEDLIKLSIIIIYANIKLKNEDVKNKFLKQIIEEYVDIKSDEQIELFTNLLKNTDSIKKSAAQKEKLLIEFLEAIPKEIMPKA
jgi:hypothetical protein